MNPTASTRQRLMTQLLQQLEDRKALVARMGGDEQVRKQHARGKLTVRERIERFFDPGTFVELGGLVRSWNFSVSVNHNFRTVPPQM
jgi:acetyl-CoA carboxylase carboxyltransferase component